MENDPINLTRAPVWKRILGLFVDTAFVIFVFMLLFVSNGNSEVIASLLGGFLGALLLGPLPTILSILANIPTPQISIFIILILYYFYCLLSELFFGRTLGKALFGLKIVSTKTGDSANSGQIIVRTLSRMIPFDPLSFFSKNPRGWHDSIARTSVVENK